MRCALPCAGPVRSRREVWQAAPLGRNGLGSVTKWVQRLEAEKRLWKRPWQYKTCLTCRSSSLRLDLVDRIRSSIIARKGRFAYDWKLARSLSFPGSLWRRGRCGVADGLLRPRRVTHL
jgi:hypothetical protein